MASAFTSAFTSTSTSTEKWVKIIIDTRERDLIDFINSNNFTSSRPFLFETATLPLGDIHILGFRGQNILLERKTYSDLAASLGDGRFKNQKDRLMKSIQENPMVSIAYILEGKGLGNDASKVSGHGRITNGQLRALIVSMTLKSRIPIIPSGSLGETFVFLQKIHNKILDDPEFLSIPVSFSGGFVDLTETDKATPAFLSKKDTVNQDAFALQSKMLTCLSGMSITRSQAILKCIQENGYTLFTIGTLSPEIVRTMVKDVKIDNKRIPITLIEEFIRVITFKSSIEI
jgi:ERCC4-type nuclease